ARIEGTNKRLYAPNDSAFCGTVVVRDGFSRAVSRRTGHWLQPSRDAGSRPGVTHRNPSPDAFGGAYRRLVDDLERYLDGPYTHVKDKELAADITRVREEPSVWYELLGGHLGVLRAE